MSDRQIHINRVGQAYGPYPEAQASEMLASGQLLAADMAWFEGAAEWKSLGEVLGTATEPPAAPPSAPPEVSGGGAPKRQVAGSKPKEEEKKKEGEAVTEGDEKDDPDNIHVTRKGEAIGPYPRDKAKQYFIAGTLLPTDWAWHDGMGEDWKPLNEVLELPLPMGVGGGGGTVSGGPWTIGGCFSEGWQTFKVNLGGAVLFCFIASIVLFITAIIPLVNPFVLVPVLAGCMYYFIKLARREPAAIGDLFAGFKRGYGQLLLVCLLIGVIWMIANLPGVSVMIFSGAAFIANLTGTIQDAMAGKIDDWEAALEGIVTSFKAAGAGLLVGMILMMLLPLIALSFTVFSMPLVIDRQMKAIDAILASARLMKGQWFKTVFFLVVVSIVSGIGQLAFGIGVLFTAPIGMAAWASFYLKNVGEITAEHTAPVAKNMKIGLICAAVLPVGAAVTAVVMAGGSIVGVAQAIDANGTGEVKPPPPPPEMDIWTALKPENVKILKQHIAAGTDLDQKEPANQNTPLHLVCVYGNIEAAKLLIKGKAKVGAKNKDGNTPLHLAAFFARPQIVKLLLDNKANPGVKAKNGQLAYHGVAQPLEQVGGIYKFIYGLLQLPLDAAEVKRLQIARPQCAQILLGPTQKALRNSRPGGQQGGRPGMQQGGRPGMQQGVRPGGQQGVRPGGQQGVRPGGQQGIRPRPQQGIGPGGGRPSSPQK